MEWMANGDMVFATYDGHFLDWHSAVTMLWSIQKMHKRRTKEKSIVKKMYALVPLATNHFIALVKVPSNAHG